MQKKLSQFCGDRRYSGMGGQALRAETEALDPPKVAEPTLGFEAIFHAQYPRLARVIGRVIRDQARSEDLAVEVFLKFWRNRAVHEENPEGWLYRVAIRKALDELRRRARRSRYENLLSMPRKTPTPEELCRGTEEQERVRSVLAAIAKRDAELLLLRSEGLSYSDLASALDLNLVSIGTLLVRAQQAFRKEYIRRYGKQA